MRFLFLLLVSTVSAFAQRDDDARIAQTTLPERPGLLKQFTSSPRPGLVCPKSGWTLDVVERGGLRYKLNLRSQEWKGNVPRYVPFASSRGLSPDGKRVVEPHLRMTPEGKPQVDGFYVKEAASGDQVYFGKGTREYQFSGDGRFFFHWTLSERALQLFSVDLGNPKDRAHLLPYGAQDLVFSGDGSRIAYFNPRDFTVTVLDARTGGTLYARSFPKLPRDEKVFISLQFTEEGRKLLVFMRLNPDSHTATARLGLYPLANLEPDYETSVDVPVWPLGPKMASGNRAQWLSASDDLLVLAPLAGGMHWLDAVTGDVLLNIPFDEDYFVNDVAFCGDGSRVITEDGYGRGAVWGLEESLSTPMGNSFAELWGALREGGRRGFTAMRTLQSVPRFREELQHAMAADLQRRRPNGSVDDTLARVMDLIPRLGNSNFRTRESARREIEGIILDIPDAWLPALIRVLQNEMKDGSNRERYRRLENILSQDVAARVQRIDQLSTRLRRGDHILRTMARH